MLLVTIILIIGLNSYIQYARASWLPTQVWEWDQVAGATSYRIYWGASPSGPWSRQDSEEFQAVDICTNGNCQADIPMPPEDLSFIVVTAINANGESDTEHGPIIN